jgi:hypothetical protein
MLASGCPKLDIGHPAEFPLPGGALSLLGFFGWLRNRMAAA